jgi:hypothetical protein
VHLGAFSETNEEGGSASAPAKVFLTRVRAGTLSRIL